MGANGTFSKGMDIPVVERKYKTVFKIDDNIMVLQRKDGIGKLPEESHTAGRIYVHFWKDGHDVKEIAKYGKNHKKIWEIHTKDHHGINPHFHYWRKGKPYGEALPLTPNKIKLLNKIRMFKYGTTK